jgi:hypothetical protein
MSLSLMLTDELFELRTRKKVENLTEDAGELVHAGALLFCLIFRKTNSSRSPGVFFPHT